MKKKIYKKKISKVILLGSGANIEAAKEDILQAFSKIIIEEDVDLVIATTIEEKGCGDKVHVSGGVRCKVSGQSPLHPLVFPWKIEINFYNFYGHSSIVQY